MEYKSQVSYIRELAHRVRDIAVSRANEAVVKRWRDVNALRKPDRAPVLIRPGAAWPQILGEDDFICADPRLKKIENDLRQVLIKNEMGDDSIALDYYPVEAAFDIDPPNIYGVGIKWRKEPVEGGAGSYLPALNTEEDFNGLVMPKYTYNREATEAEAGFVNETMGDIIPAKIIVRIYEPATICSPAADLLGMTEMMYMASDNPELLHRLMAYLRDVALSALDQKLATGLVTPNTNYVMYMSDELDPLPGEAVTAKHCFGCGNSQEFDQMSPAMWEEFLLDYQRPIYERFGLAAYGCCENLTKKLDGVFSIPNLRVFVSSAWTDLGAVIERAGRGYTVMWRQKASDISYAEDSDIKSHIADGCERLRGGYYQIVAREIMTLNGDKRRLHKWAAMAVDAAAKYS